MLTVPIVVAISWRPGRVEFSSASARIEAVWLCSYCTFLPLLQPRSEQCDLTVMMQNLQLSQGLLLMANIRALVAGQTYQYADGLPNSWCIAVSMTMFLSDDRGLCAFFASEQAARMAYQKYRRNSPDATLKDML